MQRSVLVTGIAVAALISLALTSCTAAKKSSSSSPAEPAVVTVHTTVTAAPTVASAVPIAAGAPIKLGVLTDSTGVASSGFVTTEKGIQAYLANAGPSGINGHKITYVMADTASTPAGALLGAEKLVERDKVFAIIEISSVLYGAEPYLLKQGVPVVGGAIDGPEWTEPANSNLFASVGVTNYKTVSSATGQYMKIQGVTSCAALGYAGSLSSQAAARGEMKSCQAAGLKVGYLNAQVPFGSTDMGPVALAMKKAGVDGITLSVVPSTAFALAAAVRQLGIPLKVFLTATGYGGDLLSSSAAVAVAQGYQFGSIGLPIEAVTPATAKFAAALAAVGVHDTPTFAEQEAYISMSAFAAGLHAAPPAVSRVSFMAALRGVTGFDAEGLFYPGSVNFNDYGSVGMGAGPGGCLYVAQLSGTKFIPVQGTPLCGKNLQGVSAG
jgi:branched-chain amino acid transport system substrate-binding protein